MSNRQLSGLFAVLLALSLLAGIGLHALSSGSGSNSPATVKIGEHVLQLEPGRTYDIDLTEQVDRYGAVETSKREASSTGAGFKSNLENVNIKDFQPGAPSANAEDGSASATGGSFSGTLKGVGLNAFHVLGGIMLLAAGVYWYFNKTAVKTALTIAAGGVVFIGVGVTIAEYPFVWVIGVGAFAVVLGVWVFRAYQHGQLKELVAEVKPASPTGPTGGAA